MKKIKITESQMGNLVNHINETQANVRLRNMMHEFLETDYIPSGGVKEISNQFYRTPLVKRRLDGSVITPGDLYEYMKSKFADVDTAIIKDSILGWFQGDYDKATGMRKRT